MLDQFWYVHVWQALPSKNAAFGHWHTSKKPSIVVWQCKQLISIIPACTVRLPHLRNQGYNYTLLAILHKSYKRFHCWFHATLISHDAYKHFPYLLPIHKINWVKTFVLILTECIRSIGFHFLLGIKWFWIIQEFRVCHLEAWQYDQHRHGLQRNFGGISDGFHDHWPTLGDQWDSYDLFWCCDVSCCAQCFQALCQMGELRG